MSWLREQKLLQLVTVLWNELAPKTRQELAPLITQAEMGWAIPTLDHLTDDSMLTTEQLAKELGLTPSGIRNWQSRYGLTPTDGLYRWGDVQQIRKQRNQRNTRRAS